MSRFGDSVGNDLQESDTDDAPDYLRDDPSVELIRGEHLQPWPQFPWRIVDRVAGVGLLLGITVSVSPGWAVLLWAGVIATWMAFNWIAGQIERFSRWENHRIAVRILTPVLAFAITYFATVTSNNMMVVCTGIGGLVCFVVVVSGVLLYALVQ